MARLNLAVAALMVLLVSCSSNQPVSNSQPGSQPSSKLSVNLSGYPPEFKQGYSDGCASAGVFAMRKRDEGRFKTDTNYATGWRDGFSICKSR